MESPSDEKTQLALVAFRPLIFHSTRHCLSSGTAYGMPVKTFQQNVVSQKSFFRGLFYYLFSRLSVQ